jgi:hypothetical protein
MAKRRTIAAHERVAPPHRLSDSEQEAIDLMASEIACAVADAWAELHDFDRHLVRSTFASGASSAAALDRLELITRPSAMRKVRP